MSNACLPARIIRTPGVVAIFVGLAFSALGDSKTVVLDDLPRYLDNFEVCDDGSRLYFGAGRGVLVFDARGKVIDKYGSPMPVRDFMPLPNGWFIGCLTYNGGQMALFRPDGSYARKLVGKTGPPRGFRGDMTGWTSPTGAAVDPAARLIFALDVTMAPRDDRNIPDPDFSRIAVFDFDGNYIRSIHHYNYYAKEPQNDDARTWYDDIEVDPQRKRVYVTARNRRALIAFDYEGNETGRIEGVSGYIAVFPDGRLAVSAGPQVQIYDPQLKPLRQVKAQYLGRGIGCRDLEADAAGRLYASAQEQSVTFVRWDAALENCEVFGPRYVTIRVNIPGPALTAGEPLKVPVSVEGRPEPDGTVPWQVMFRPSDGSDLRWQVLPSRMVDGNLVCAPPDEWSGPYEMAVKYGEGPICWGDRSNELYCRRTVVFAPPGAEASVTVFTSDGRRAFRQGERILLQIVRRGADIEPAPVAVSLRSADATLSRSEVTVGASAAFEVPSDITRRLAPGRYEILPEIAGHHSYPLQFQIAQARPDSPMQRILYHEFGRIPPRRDVGLADEPERKQFIRSAAEMAHWLGWTRQTDRMGNSMVGNNQPVGWSRDAAGASLKAPGYAAPEHYLLSNGQWGVEYYLDEAVANGISYDTQMLYHCDGVKFRKWRLDRFVPAIQRLAQWLGRWPSFYGFNYNDEMFFGGWAQGWTDDDKEWLEKVKAEECGGDHVAALFRGLRTMYDAFNQAVRQVRPRLKITTTPMWQFPAVEGSYAPVIYDGMDETYSHFLSEGYQYPWYPAHSAAFLRLPGKPLMGVFDNGYSTLAADVTIKNAMQVLAQGVQGVGAQHTTAFKDPWGAKAYRTINMLARLYGPVFAEVPPAPEAAVLYSLTQDITERRNQIGTPHFERVFTLYGCGLMAGVPMQIVYEESIADGWLLENGKPRFPMLILAGQKERLPEKVEQAIRAFQAAGGKLYLDEVLDPQHNGVAHLKPKVMGINTHILKSAFHEGYAADSMSPVCQPLMEQLAVELRKAVEADLAFPMKTDDPWVAATRFDGGAVQYVMVVTETSPYPWNPGTVWSLRNFYCKNFGSWLPRVTRLTLPRTNGVIYDMFDRRVVRRTVAPDGTELDADLRTWPARLYAICPRPMGSPSLTWRSVPGGRLAFAAQIRDDNGRDLAARVPVRVRLFSANTTAQEYTAATDAGGRLTDELPLPANAARWTLEVTELISGKARRADVTAERALAKMLVPRPDAELFLPDGIRRMLSLARKQGRLGLEAPGGLLSQETIAKLTDALARRGVKLEPGTAPGAETSPGTYLAVGTQQGNKVGALLNEARRRGLLPLAVTANTPGPGRGLAAPVFAPRGRDEHILALLGGDADGLAKTVERFINWLAEPPKPQAAEPGPADLTGGQAGIEASPDLPRLSDQVGVFLDEIAVSADGTHLAVSARGFHDNLALIRDDGNAGAVVRSIRIGQGNALTSTWISRDGRLFGAAGLTVHRYSEVFHLADSDNSLIAFPCYGNPGGTSHTYAVSQDGRTLLAPGTYGVICWRRDGAGWKRQWSMDYWKQFSKLDWPVHGLNHRTPAFNAVIPRGADYALVLFSENSNNGWVQPQYHNTASLQAVDLASGRPRWTFEVPIPNTQLFPRLYTSPSGRRLMLHVQMGSWRQESHRYYTIGENGSVLGSWKTGTGVTPRDVAVSDAGAVALVFERRLLEVRGPDARLLYNLLWPTQPVSVAFDTGGRRVFVCDDRGRLTCLDEAGRPLWQKEIGCVSNLATTDGKLYAAGWDGRLRSYRTDGSHRWTLNLTPAMVHERPLKAYAASAQVKPEATIAASHPPTTASTVPPGENLLETGRATLKLGGTQGWMSNGTVQVTAEELTNGNVNDVDTPWLHVDEVFWDATAGRPVYAEITFRQPTDVTSLTVFENPKYPYSWPTEAVVQVWNEELEKWDTTAFGIFLAGPVNTYKLDLKGVKKLRYVPWSSYYRNFHTSEIQVRGRASAAAE